MNETLNLEESTVEARYAHPVYLEVNAINLKVLLIVKNNWTNENRGK